jgi:hypothetical protein
MEPWDKFGFVLSILAFVGMGYLLPEGKFLLGIGKVETWLKKTWK